MTAELLRTAFEAAAPTLMDEVTKAKGAFVQAFGDMVHSSHLPRLNEMFMDAGRAKMGSLFADDPRQAAELNDIFEARCDSIELLGLADWITDKAIAVRAMKASLKQILHGLAVGFGLAVKAIMGVVLPGIGAIGGAVAGPGITFLLDHVFGSTNG